MNGSNYVVAGCDADFRNERHRDCRGLHQIGTFMLNRFRRALQWIADKITDWNYQGIVGHIDGMRRMEKVGWSVGYIDLRTGARIYEHLDEVPEWTHIDEIQQVIYLKKSR